MKKQNSPPGFELWHGSLAADPFWLPHSVVEDVAAQKAQVLKEEVAALHAARMEKESLARLAPESVPFERMLAQEGRFNLAEPPLHGFHRVLPRFDEATAERPTNSADEDVRKQREKVRQYLLKAGPDRRVARPAHWQDEFALLAEEMPNFAEPIELVRNMMALAKASDKVQRIPPMMLLGPPGVGKTLFSQRLAEILGAPYFAIAFDQPSAGSQLRGSDKYWGNTEPGALFNLLCMGDYANPVILLDEIDKAISGSDNKANPITQLHGTLEAQTAAKTVDLSTEIEFDASLVTYIATANSLNGIGLPLLSRFEAFRIALPDRHQAIRISERLTKEMLAQLELVDHVMVQQRAHYVLSAMSPRIMKATLRKLIAAAVQAGAPEIRADDVWRAMHMEDQRSRLH